MTQGCVIWPDHYLIVGNLNFFDGLRPVNKIIVCETLMPPFPNISRIYLTLDLDLLPTELNIDRGHVLIKDYLPTKVEASRAKCS